MATANNFFSLAFSLSSPTPVQPWISSRRQRQRFSRSVRKYFLTNQPYCSIWISYWCLSMELREWNSRIKFRTVKAGCNALLPPINDCFMITFSFPLDALRSLRHNDTCCRDYFRNWPVDRFRVWIWRSRIYFISAAPSRETKARILMKMAGARFANKRSPHCVFSVSKPS
jgi:hypothetical protein